MPGKRIDYGIERQRHDGFVAGTAAIAPLLPSAPHPRTPSPPSASTCAVDHRPWGSIRPASARSGSTTWPATSGNGARTDTLLAKVQKNGEKYSPHTVNKIIAILRQITAEASDEFGIADPCRRVADVSLRGHRTATRKVMCWVMRRSQRRLTGCRHARD